MTSDRASHPSREIRLSGWWGWWDIYHQQAITRASSQSWMRRELSTPPPGSYQAERRWNSGCHLGLRQTSPRDDHLPKLTLSHHVYCIRPKGIVPSLPLIAAFVIRVWRLPHYHCCLISERYVLASLKFQDPSRENRPFLTIVAASVLKFLSLPHGYCCQRSKGIVLPSLLLLPPSSTGFQHFLSLSKSVARLL